MICDICDCALVQRSDDKPEIVRKRLQTYYEHEKSLLDFYNDIDKNIELLNVDQSLDQVYGDFVKFLDNEK